GGPQHRARRGALLGGHGARALGLDGDPAGRASSLGPGPLARVGAHRAHCAGARVRSLAPHSRHRGSASGRFVEVLMRDRPSAADLIEIAREVLQQELLPRLPPEARIHGLMVANALANAEREISAGMAPLVAELGRLASRYGEAMDACGGEQLQAVLERLNRRLVADIR